MIESLITYFTTLPPLVGYLAVFLLMMVEGDVALFTFAFLTSVGVFQIPYMLFSVVVGTLLGDVVWYAAGRYAFQARILTWLRVIVTHMASPFESHLTARPFHTLFVSRFTYGIHHALLARAGMLKVPFRTVFSIDCPAILCWTAVIGSIGYFSGASFEFVKQWVRVGQGALFIAVISFIIIDRIIRRRIKQRL